MKLYLIGMPLCGKSYIGLEVAKKLNLAFIDLDGLIESKTHKTIEDIFKFEGEQVFRTYETDSLSALIDKDNVVISTGGGIVINKDNKLLMNGIIIYINTDIEILEERGNHSYPRPLLQKTSLYDLFNERSHLYEEFMTYKVENNGLMEDTVKKIVDILGGN